MLSKESSASRSRVTLKAVMANREFISSSGGILTVKTGLNGAVVSIGPPLEESLLRDLESVYRKLKSALSSNFLTYFHPLKDLHITVFTLQLPVLGQFLPHVESAKKEITECMKLFGAFKLEVKGLKLIGGGSLAAMVKDEKEIIKEMRSTLAAAMPLAHSRQNEIVHITFARFLDMPDPQSAQNIDNLLKEFHDTHIGSLKVREVKFLLLRTRYLEHHGRERVIRLES